MRNTIGNLITMTLFGESHGTSIGCVIDGLPAGIEIDEELLKTRMNQRRAQGELSTSRHEEDQVVFESGVYQGFTTGSSILIRIKNGDVHSSSYEDIKRIPRVNHADYPAQVRYQGFQDVRGGGHFSGRLSAPLVAAGSIFESILIKKGIYVGTHVYEVFDHQDREFDWEDFPKDIKQLETFPILDAQFFDYYQNQVLEAKKAQDSIGAILETGIVGLPAGVGEPFFSTVEGELSKAIFAIPSIKGISFGDGFGFAKHKGSEVLDSLRYEDGKVVHKANHNGGINGGLSNGAPIVFHSVVKPTSSIGQSQQSIDLEEKVNATLEVKGRHDPCIAHRAAVVVSSMSCFVILDLLACMYGSEWLKA